MESILLIRISGLYNNISIKMSDIHEIYFLTEILYKNNKVYYYFTNKENILRYLNKLQLLEEIELPFTNQYLKVKYCGNFIWSTNMIKNLNKYKLSDISTFKYLYSIKAGPNIKSWYIVYLFRKKSLESESIFNPYIKIIEYLYSIGAEKEVYYDIKYRAIKNFTLYIN